MTWRKIAAEIPMQYTYLSKALNDDSTHLSEDHLFVVCRSLEFFPDECDFISLQRSYVTSNDPERKVHLHRKIREILVLRKLNAKEQHLSPNKMADQMQYLFEPLCLVVHQALEMANFRKDPQRLCGHLAISPARLKEILRILSRNDYIDLDDDGLGVCQEFLEIGGQHLVNMGD